MKVKFEIHGAKEINRALAALDLAAGGQIRGAVEETIEQVRDRAKLNAPYGSHDGHHHPPGQLQEAIIAEMIGESLYGRAGVPKGSPAAAYAPIVEFGDKGRNKPAQPYLWPAAAAERARHVARVQMAIRRSIRLARRR